MVSLSYYCWLAKPVLLSTCCLQKSCAFFILPTLHQIKILRNWVVCFGGARWHHASCDPLRTLFVFCCFFAFVQSLRRLKTIATRIIRLTMTVAVSNFLSSALCHHEKNRRRVRKTAREVKCGVLWPKDAFFQTVKRVLERRYLHRSKIWKLSTGLLLFGN